MRKATRSAQIRGSVLTHLPVFEDCPLVEHHWGVQPKRPALPGPPLTPSSFSTRPPAQTKRPFLRPFLQLFFTRAPGIRPPSLLAKQSYNKHGSWYQNTQACKHSWLFLLDGILMADCVAVESTHSFFSYSPPFTYMNKLSDSSGGLTIAPHKHSKLKKKNIFSLKQNSIYSRWSLYFLAPFLKKSICWLLMKVDYWPWTKGVWKESFRPSTLSSTLSIRWLTPWVETFRKQWIFQNFYLFIYFAKLLKSWIVMLYQTFALQ